MATGMTKIEDLLEQSKYEWGTVKDTHPEIALSNSVRKELKDIIRLQVSDVGISPDLQLDKGHKTPKMSPPTNSFAQPQLARPCFTAPRGVRA